MVAGSLNAISIFKLVNCQRINIGFSVLDLLSKGVSINFNDVQGEGMTLLHQACVYDDYIIAQALIKQGRIDY